MDRKPSFFEKIRNVFNPKEVALEKEKAERDEKERAQCDEDSKFIDDYLVEAKRKLPTLSTFDEKIDILHAFLYSGHYDKFGYTNGEKIKAAIRELIKMVASSFTSNQDFDESLDWFNLFLCNANQGGLVIDDKEAIRVVYPCFYARLLKGVDPSVYSSSEAILDPVFDELGFLRTNNPFVEYLPNYFVTNKGPGNPELVKAIVDMYYRENTVLTIEDIASGGEDGLESLFYNTALIGKEHIINILDIYYALSHDYFPDDRKISNDFVKLNYNSFTNHEDWIQFRNDLIYQGGHPEKTVKPEHVDDVTHETPVKDYAEILAILDKVTQ